MEKNLLFCNPFKNSTFSTSLVRLFHHEIPLIFSFRTWSALAASSFPSLLSKGSATRTSLFSFTLFLLLHILFQFTNIKLILVTEIHKFQILHHFLKVSKNSCTPVGFCSAPESKSNLQYTFLSSPVLYFVHQSLNFMCKI